MTRSSPSTRSLTANPLRSSGRLRSIETLRQGKPVYHGATLAAVFLSPCQNDAEADSHHSCTATGMSSDRTSGYDRILHRLSRHPPAGILCGTSSCTATTHSTKMAAPTPDKDTTFSKREESLTDSGRPSHFHLCFKSVSVLPIRLYFKVRELHNPHKVLIFASAMQSRSRSSYAKCGTTVAGQRI